MSLARQVTLFVVDGLRPDALRQADTPQIDSLAADGACTWQAQAVFPSVSLPCRLSMFLAVAPSLHGVLSNLWVRPELPVPSLFEVVQAAGQGTAAFYSWEELRDLAKPGVPDFAYFNRLGDPEGDRDVER